MDKYRTKGRGRRKRNSRCCGRRDGRGREENHESHERRITGDHSETQRLRCSLGGCRRMREMAQGRNRWKMAQRSTVTSCISGVASNKEVDGEID